MNLKIKLSMLFICMTFSINLFATGENIANTNIAFEILTWKSKDGISDEDMIKAVDSMAVDLKELSGFLNQTLYKDKDEIWIDIYYWVSEKDAHNSNESMANKESFKKLMSIIKAETVTLKVVSPKQTSGEILFK